jgi:CHASE3 domain sensor protein
MGLVLLRTTVLSIAVLLAAFAISAILLRTAIVGALAEQENLRHADVQRALVFRLQLDEETGLRGFSLTHNPGFLLPLRQAREQLPAAMRSLEGDLHAIDVGALPAFEAERRLISEWSSRVMVPIATNPRADTIALEVRGKTLADRLRAANDALGASLTQVATQVDARARLLVARIVTWSAALIALLVVVLLFYAVAQARLLRDLIESGQAYEREREISQMLQDAFLLEALPNVENLEFDAAYASAQEAARVGGDWYGVVKLGDGRIFFSVGDVAGNGLQAAVAMVRARQTLLASAVRETSPSRALEAANAVLRVRSETMVTAVCGYIEPASNELRYACAGHPPPLLLSPGGRTGFLECQGTALGIVPDPKARDYALRIEPGSTLILYTDGILEFDRNLGLGERRLREVASAAVRESSGQLARTVLNRVVGRATLRDDVAILVIKWKDP